MNVDDILNERKETHGDFKENSTISQDLKSIIRAQAKYKGLTFAQRESLDMICHKIGRILSGNPDFKDHWADIADYAELIARDLK